MTEQNERIFFILLRIFVSLAVIGLLILVVTNINKNPSDIAFSLIAFILSVAALVMTTLQSISISRQVRVTKRAAELIRDTSEQLGLLTKQEHTLEREVRQDLETDEEIMAVLEEFGVGDSKEERIKVASKIAKRVGHKK